MAEEHLTARCPCGWETTGTEDDVVAATREHGTEAHDKEMSRADVLAVSTPIEETD